MFEKIERYAESVATRAGQSRRGFLGQLGKAALGAAGVVGGLLLVPGRAAAAADCTGHCVYQSLDGTTKVDVSCMKGCTCAPTRSHGGITLFLAFSNCTVIS